MSVANYSFLACLEVARLVRLARLVSVGQAFNFSLNSTSCTMFDGLMISSLFS